MGRRWWRCFLTSEDMTASSAFDVIFVGAGHTVLIAARHLAENGGSVCQLDQPDTGQASYRTV
jgi:ribulose 1,5-bisphosphate synthetase/thiazole synthase